MRVGDGFGFQSVAGAGKRWVLTGKIDISPLFLIVAAKKRIGTKLMPRMLSSIKIEEKRLFIVRKAQTFSSWRQKIVGIKLMPRMLSSSSEEDKMYHMRFSECGRRGRSVAGGGKNGIFPFFIVVAAQKRIGTKLMPRLLSSSSEDKQ